MTMRLAACTIATLLVCSNALAQLLTEKKFFTLPQYTTAGGKTIKNVRVGYETYGKLNAAGDNAVFIAHFFSGTSHAAGRYKADEKAAGYWDAIIGPGKRIDHNKPVDPQKSSRPTWKRRYPGRVRGAQATMMALAAVTGALHTSSTPAS